MLHLSDLSEHVGKVLTDLPPIVQRVARVMRQDVDYSGTTFHHEENRLSLEVNADNVVVAAWWG